MFTRRKLACSFCGKSAAEVSKLVAGPNVYICDACVAVAARIMSESGDADSSGAGHAPGLWRRVREWIIHRVRASHEARSIKAPA